MVNIQVARPGFGLTCWTLALPSPIVRRGHLPSSRWVGPGVRGVLKLSPPHPADGWHPPPAGSVCGRRVGPVKSNVHVLCAFGMFKIIRARQRDTIRRLCLLHTTLHAGDTHRRDMWILATAGWQARLGGPKFAFRERGPGVHTRRARPPSQEGASQGTNLGRVLRRLTGA